MCCSRAIDELAHGQSGDMSVGCLDLFLPLMFTIVLSLGEWSCFKNAE